MRCINFSMCDLCVIKMQVRMMEHEQVLVKLRAKDRIGLLMDLIQAFWSLNLHVRHANISSSTGNGNNVFAAKVLHYIEELRFYLPILSTIDL